MTEIDSTHYRHVLGHFPTGVTVVSGIDDDQPVGLAIGSFFSVSLEPALVGFCVGKTSGSWPRIERSGAFCVNILAADQEDVCAQFASKAVDKFEGIPWEAGPTGSPVIADVLGWIDCEIHEILEGGDHHIVLGKVQELAAERDTAPLVFLRGKYALLA